MRTLEKGGIGSETVVVVHGSNRPSSDTGIVAIHGTKPPRASLCTLISPHPRCSTPSMLSRRTFLAVATLSMPCVLHAGPRRFGHLPTAFAQIEETNGGRLGVAVLDSASDERSGYRADERFPLCSTFKFLLASAVLQRVDGDRETLNRAIAIPPKPLLFFSTTFGARMSFSRRMLSPSHSGSRRVM